MAPTLPMQARARPIQTSRAPLSSLSQAAVLLYLTT